MQQLPEPGAKSWMVNELQSLTFVDSEAFVLNISSPARNEMAAKK